MNTELLTKVIAENVKQLQKVLTKKEFEKFIIESLDHFAVTNDERLAILEGLK